MNIQELLNNIPPLKKDVELLKLKKNFPFVVSKVRINSSHKFEIKEFKTFENEVDYIELPKDEKLNLIKHIINIFSYTKTITSERTNRGLESTEIITDNQRDYRNEYKRLYYEAQPEQEQILNGFDCKFDHEQLTIIHSQMAENNFIEAALSDFLYIFNSRSAEIKKPIVWLITSNNSLKDVWFPLPLFLLVINQRIGFFIFAGLLLKI